MEQQEKGREAAEKLAAAENNEQGGKGDGSAVTAAEKYLKSGGAGSSGTTGDDGSTSGGDSSAKVGQKEEDGEVQDGLEVEGPFNSKPELKSRLADKNSSLKFVTAEEDARMRKEELAKVFGARDTAGGAVKAATLSLAPVPEGEVASKGVTNGGQDVPTGAGQSDALAGPGMGVETIAKQKGGEALAGGLVGGGDAKGRIKAFGAILEKTLNQNMSGRAPPPGAVAGGKHLQEGFGGKGRFLSPNRQAANLTVAGSNKKEERACSISPQCKPKSKFFRSICSPTKGNDAEAAAGVRATADAPPIRPSPPPMMGLLSQIRAAREGEGAGGGQNDEKAAVPGGLLAQIRAQRNEREGGRGNETKAVMGGLLAQIQAKAGDQNKAAEGATEDGVVATSGHKVTSASHPMPPPPPPPPPMTQPRSLFGNTAGSSGARTGQGGVAPPPDFLAEVRAKAAAREALRRAAAPQEV